MTTHPTALAAWVESRPRHQAIDGHGFSLNIGKWNGMVAQLPGTPLVGEDGGMELGFISRGGLFRLANAAREDESGVAALHLFWQSLACFFGNPWLGAQEPITVRRDESHRSAPTRCGRRRFYAIRCSWRCMTRRRLF